LDAVVCRRRLTRAHSRTRRRCVQVVARRCSSTSMNQSTSMAGVGDQEDITTVDLMATSSVMEASCALPIDGVGGTRGDDEDQLTQVVYSFR